MNADAEYWLSLAAQWIQSKSQTQMSFPTNFPTFNHNSHIIIPEAPRISNIDATANDNLVEADMEIDEEVKEEEPTQIWEKWQNEKTDTKSETLPTLHNQQSSPAMQSHRNNHQNNRNNHKNFMNKKSRKAPETKFVPIPSAPIIGNVETSQSVDMILDSEDEDDTSPSVLEAQKRKKLPIWIREGLERIEREKKQEALRIQKEKEQQENEASRKKVMEEALKELEREKQTKSKYESDSEEEEKQRDETPETEIEQSARLQEDEEDEEGLYEKMMLLVREELTKILLEVTNEKILEISSETLSKYRRKASSVTTNRSVTNSLGLGVYSNSSDEESEEESSERADEQSDWEPDSVLKERIRAKAIAFDQKTRDIIDQLADLEQQRTNEKLRSTVSNRSKFDSDDEKLPKATSRKNEEKFGEEKFEQNYSVSSSFASASRRDKKKTRFNDPKERSANVLVTHVGMLDTKASDNGSNAIASTFQLTEPQARSKKRDTSTTSSTSSSGSRHKKHKKHKKSSKHSKKSSKKRNRSRSRDHDKDKRKSYKSDRHSIESKSSVRSSESKRHRSRSRDRSKSRDRRHRRY